MNQIYQYLTRQTNSKEVYDTYIDLTNKCYFPNREVICHDWVHLFCDQMRVLLDRDYSSPMTFIILNDGKHFKKMHQIIDIIELWNTDPTFHDFADQEEFFEILNAIRKQFNIIKIDIPSAVGKWPRKDRTRARARPN